MTLPLPLAAAVSATVTALGWRLGALTGSGAMAAWTVGTLILVGTGWPGGATLAAFFVSSSAVSRLAAPRQGAVVDAKGNCRDHWQVLANGGAAMLGSLVGLRNAGLGLWIVTSSLAAAAADTWATSLGAWSRSLPRHLLTWRSVPAGTSGGMTLTGTIGALVGAGLVAAAGSGAGRMPSLLPVASLIGFGGMVLDSALGATAQAGFRCPRCEVASEWAVHRCGTPTVRLRGWAWLNNDGVNGLATAAAAVAGWVAWAWVSPASG